MSTEFHVVRVDLSDDSIPRFVMTRGSTRGEVMILTPFASEADVWSYPWMFKRQRALVARLLPHADVSIVTLRAAVAAEDDDADESDAIDCGLKQPPVVLSRRDLDRMRGVLLGLRVRQISLSDGWVREWERADGLRIWPFTRSRVGLMWQTARVCDGRYSYHGAFATLEAAAGRVDA